MAKILIQFAHPLLEKSRVQKQLLLKAKEVSGVTINDLYEHYPDFDIDVAREKSLLLKHDVIVLQHPFYWYSTPAIIKQWFDLVLEHGWAYGRKGDMLSGKWLMNALSCGGSEQAYRSEGRNRFTVRQMLAPVEQTAKLCQMEFLPPFVVYGTHKLKDFDIDHYSSQYAIMLNNLVTGSLHPSDLQSDEAMHAQIQFPESF
jgi:glutathione-regulated potassium-efflux system ancillary protein KefG